MSAPMTAEEKLEDLLAGIRSLAEGYEKLRSIPTGAEIASDIRVLLEIVEAPARDTTRLDAARRRANYVAERIACPKCGQPAGSPCVLVRTVLGRDERGTRAYPHREREDAERKRRIS